MNKGARMMAKRYRRSFQFFDTEKQAKEFCDKKNKNPYIKKHHKAVYKEWYSSDGTEHAYIAHYSYN